MYTSRSFRQLFLTLFILFAGLLAASVLSAWTGPTATAPSGNVSAPINVGTTDQVKNGGLSVNALTVFGSQYIQSKLGINKTSPVVALQVAGTVIVGNGGEVCQAVTEGAQRYNSTTKVMEYCDGTGWKAFSITSQPQVSTYDTTGTHTWTKPSTGSMAFIECWGGGGGGAGGYGGTGMTGGGGGGYVSKTMTLASLPATVTVTVGGGGTAGPYSYTSVGGNGGTSSFGAYAIGYGGYGGGSNTARDSFQSAPAAIGAMKTAGGAGLGGSYGGGTGEKGGDGASPSSYDANGNPITYPPGTGACAGGGGGTGPASAGGTSGCGGNGGAGGGNAGAAPGGAGGGGATYGIGGSGAAGKCVVTVS